MSFLRVLSADESLDDLQPGFRIVYARSGAGSREAIVIMPAASSELAEAAGRAARLARGALFTGAGKHFVQFRDAQAEGDVSGDLDAETLAQVAVGGFIGMQTITEQLGDDAFVRRVESLIDVVRRATTPRKEGGT